MHEFEWEKSFNLIEFAFINKYKKKRMHEKSK
jgi:hypothetical protein